MSAAGSAQQQLLPHHRLLPHYKQDSRYAIANANAHLPQTATK